MAALNNQLFLFTLLPNNNRIYRFDTAQKEWKELIQTGNFFVSHPIQAVAVDKQVYVLTKRFGAMQGNLYQIDVERLEASLVDDKFLATGISECYSNMLCGFEIAQDSEKKPYFKLRILPSQPASSQALTLNGAVVRPAQIKSLHKIQNDLYVLLKADNEPPLAPYPKRTLHRIAQNGKLSAFIRSQHGISSIAKRLSNLQSIQHHPSVNGLAWLYMSAPKAKASSIFSCEEPWAINLKEQTAQLLHDILTPSQVKKMPKNGCVSSFTTQTKPIKLNGKILFIANGGTQGDNASGTELWVSDGTAKGTQLLKDIASGGANGVLVEQGHSHHLP